MGRIADMAGKKFGKLTVVEMSDKQGIYYRYLCKCDCGNAKVLRGASLRSGLTKSCGCIRSEYMSNKNYKHGQSHTSAYKCAWSRVMHMKRKFRLPKWADVEAIRQFYMNKPQGCEVDHIIPLSGKTVSGLHVLENLQYLTIAENRSKNNKFIGV
jgi:hypothetical protein